MYCRMIYKKALLLFFILVFGLPTSFAQNCDLDFTKLNSAPIVKAVDKTASPQKTIIISLQKLAVANTAERNIFLQKLEMRAQSLKNRAHKIAMQNDSAGIEYFEKVGAQVPKEGYVRAVSTEEIKNILQDGGMGSAYDFNFKGNGARVGHGGNFIFVLCRRCSVQDFSDGALGSSMLNNRAFRLNELELIVPYIPQ